MRAIGFGEIFSWDKEAFIDQGVAVLGYICDKETGLAIIHFADCPAVLAGNTNRIITLF